MAKNVIHKSKYVNNYAKHNYRKCHWMQKKAEIDSSGIFICKMHKKKSPKLTVPAFLYVKNKKNSLEQTVPAFFI
jgi:hypothetical protein